MGNETGDESPTLDYWDRFYADRRSTAVPSNPSAFAQWVHDELGDSSRVAELGFGTARDSYWLADQGHILTGYDGAHSAVELANSHAHQHGLGATFHELDLTHHKSVEIAASDVADRGGVDAVYARFLLHSLPEEGRTNAVQFAARALGSNGGRAFFEFRTGKDAESPHLFGDDHFRAYLDPHEVAEVIRREGGELQHLEQGHGLAIYKSEDPHVARIVAQWGGSA